MLRRLCLRFAVNKPEFDSSSIFENVEVSCTFALKTASSSSSSTSSQLAALACSVPASSASEFADSNAADDVMKPPFDMSRIAATADLKLDSLVEVEVEVAGFLDRLAAVNVDISDGDGGGA